MGHGIRDLYFNKHMRALYRVFVFLRTLRVRRLFAEMESW